MSLIDNSKIYKKLIIKLTSKNAINLSIFIGTLIVLTLLLTSRYYLFKNIIENGISKKNIYATQTVQVVDSERTEQRKKLIAQRIEPILIPAQDEYLKKNLEEIFASLTNIRQSKDSSATKYENIISLLDISSNDKDYETESAINYLYRCSDRNFEKIKKGTDQTLDILIDNGISESMLDKESNSILGYVSGDYSLRQKQVVSFLIKKIVAPNMVIDELATDVARKNAVNSVKPVVVTFEKGQQIVAEGDIVTHLQKSALKKMGYNISELNWYSVLGVIFLTGICLSTLIYYLFCFDSKYLLPSYLSLMALLSVFIIACSVYLPVSVPVYAIPFVAIAMLLTIFTNPRIALLMTVLVITLVSILLQYKIDYLPVFIIGTMVSIFMTSKVNYTRRMDLVKIGFYIGLVNVVIILSVYFLLNNINYLTITSLATDIFLGFMSGIVSSIIALGTMPLIESFFKISTPYGLAELADHNQPLLKRLQFEAPGTYHHSLMMANLAEAAAEAVDADQILVRVGAFYHDIGKLKRPLFFVENQSYFGIENPHEKLNPRLSKMVVTAHPKDGIELAKEYKLPVIIHQFILQHHGDGLASYFYNQALKEEGAENINQEQFRYTCPKPSSKEAAIIMLADATESAVRSLKTPTQEEIEDIINKIIKDRLMDGQLSESPLTQKDLKVIAATFNRILRGMQHHRIKYHENIVEELGKKTAQKQLEEIKNSLKNENI